MEKEETICGVTLKEIRKHYFKGKVEKLLLDIQANIKEDFPVEDFEKLKKFLGSLRDSDRKLNKEFSEFIPKLDIDKDDSVLDELTQESLSESEMAELSKEKNNRESAVKIASMMLKKLFARFYNSSEASPNEKELMDMAFEMLGLQYYLMRDSLYKERLYRKKIVEFERSGKQRKMAEELAKTTTEYRNFNLAEGLNKLAVEFINLAKKRYKDL